MAVGALGTDTGGSCRIPAAVCGIVGYKPTAKRIPTDGVLPLSFTLDSVGPLAPTVACCAALDAIMAGEAQDDLMPWRLEGLRLAAPQTMVLDGMDSTVAAAFGDALLRLSKAGAKIVDVERFSPSAGAIVDPAAALTKANPDAVLIAQGGALLRGIAPTLAYKGLKSDKVKLLGTGLWDDPSVGREPLLVGGWFAAPEPDADDAFIAKYKSVYGTSPSQSQLAALAYDAVSLVALLASGQPYRRFTRDALTDPNGFAGVDGIFRLNIDGTAERGLAILAVTPSGFQVVDPAPRTFQKPAS